MAEKNMQKNRDFVEKNRKELLEAYRNKYLLIVDQEVVDSFDTYEKAAEVALSNYGEEGNFLIHHMTEKEPLNFVLSAKF